MQNTDYYVAKDTNSINYLVINGKFPSDIKRIVTEQRVTKIALRNENEDDLLKLDTIKDQLKVLTVDFPLSTTRHIPIMSELRELYLNTVSQLELNKCNFPKLESFAISYPHKIASLKIEIPTLHKLVIFNGTKKLNSFLNCFNAIKVLSIRQSLLVSFEDFEKFQDIGSLTMYKVNEIDNSHKISKLKNLHTLKIIMCKKFKDYKTIGDLSNLEILYLVDQGDIPNLAWVSDLSKLKEFIFSGKTNISDGKIQLLTYLNKLRQVSFEDRKHYDVNRKDLQQKLALNSMKQLKTE